MKPSDSKKLFVAGLSLGLIALLGGIALNSFTRPKFGDEPAADYEQKAFTLLSEAETWIKTLNQVPTPGSVDLPERLKPLATEKKVLVFMDGSNRWFVFSAKVGGIDNGIGYAYCDNPTAKLPSNAVEQIIEWRRVNRHWVWFRFT